MTNSLFDIIQNNTNNLNTLRVFNLKKRAKNIGIKGYSKLRRAELINAIRKKQ